MKYKIIFLILALMILPVVSAGVGLKWEKESIMVDENQKNCISYSVYNPWPEESYIQLELSNDELKDVLIEQEAEAKLIPSNTFHNDAIPIQFCFKVPKVYKKDCLLPLLLCKQECKEEQKVYSGKVIAKTVPPPNQMGGSATTAAISAPLNVRVTCRAFERNYTPLYVIIGVIALAIIFLILRKRFGKSKLERDKDRLRKLQERIRKEKK